MMGGLLLSLKNEIVKIAPRGRINCVAPGWVRTPMADRAMADSNLLYQALASYGRIAHQPSLTVCAHAMPSPDIAVCPAGRHLKRCRSQKTSRGRFCS